MKLLIAILLICALTVGSYATSVSVATQKYAGESGILTNIYFENADAPTSTTPSVVTGTTQPGTSGSTNVARAGTVYLYSVQFPGARSIAAGGWVVDAWALASKVGAMTVSIDITDSAGVVQANVASGTTPSVAKTEGQVVVTFSGSATSVPANGYIRVTLTAPTGDTATLFWGVAQGTNFQVPMSVESA